MEFEKRPQENPVEAPIAVIETLFADEVSEEQKFREAVVLEQKEANDRFKELIDKVSDRYRENGSMSEKMLGEFIVHNVEVLESAVELGLRKGFTEEELRRLEVSAVLHDMTKADAVPEHFKDIPNYALAIHGEAAGEESLDILTDEYLASKGFEGDFEEIRQEVSRAIREHMGPHPGFMDGILAGVNSRLRESGEPEITHPKAEGRISEALLAVDMRSLAGEKGRKKVMAIRAGVPVFRAIDQKTVEAYKAVGVDFTLGEAALLSGFESAFQARDMLNDPENKEWIDEVIEASKGGEYHYGSGDSEEIVRWADVEKKWHRYEDLRRANELAVQISSDYRYGMLRETEEV
jgi:hypothetical protein